MNAMTGIFRPQHLWRQGRVIQLHNGQLLELKGDVIVQDVPADAQFYMVPADNVHVRFPWVDEHGVAHYEEVVLLEPGEARFVHIPTRGDFIVVRQSDQAVTVEVAPENVRPRE